MVHTPAAVRIFIKYPLVTSKAPRNRFQLVALVSLWRLLNHSFYFHFVSSPIVLSCYRVSETAQKKVLRNVWLSSDIYTTNRNAKRKNGTLITCLKASNNASHNNITSFPPTKSHLFFCQPTFLGYYRTLRHLMIK